MKQPLCSNRDDGTCESFALNGTRYCLRHGEPTRTGSFGNWVEIDTGYRPGGIGTRVPPPVVDRPAVTVKWKDPAPPVRRRGWSTGRCATAGNDGP